MSALAGIKKWHFESFMAGLFLITALGLFGWCNMTKPRILILHSYDEDYAWVRDVNIGLARGFKNKYLYQLKWYYMDTKRHPSEAFKSSAGIAARNVILETKPDVIIAVDDDAQKYAAQYFINDPHIKIVYTGINNQAEDYGYQSATNATGILERLPLSAMRETLSSVSNFKTLGHPVRLAYLGDLSRTVQGDIKQVKGFDWSPHQLVAVNQVNTFAEWQAQIELLATQADIILVTGYRGLVRSKTDSKLVPPKEVVAWTEAHSVIPVFSGNGFYTEDGGMLAIGTSPYEQGNVAANDALAIILDGKLPAELPKATSQQFIVTMSGSKMNARHFELPRVYEAAARTGDKYFP
jgi:ABC-type uncharacterized transport system substrate-binding protein